MSAPPLRIEETVDMRHFATQPTEESKPRRRKRVPDILEHVCELLSNQIPRLHPQLPKGEYLIKLKLYDSRTNGTHDLSAFLVSSRVKEVQRGFDSGSA